MLTNDQKQIEKDAGICAAVTVLFLERNATQLKMLMDSLKNHNNKKRIASLAGAYLMSETALKEYKEKAKEVVGAKKAQQISDEIVQDHMDSLKKHKS